MDKIDTPRTDAEEFTVDDGMEWDGKSVSADFARTLERELSQALARVTELEGALAIASGRFDAIADEIRQHGSCTRHSIQVYAYAVDARKAIKGKS